MVEMIGPLVLYSVLEFPCGVRMTPPAPKGTDRLGDDKRRVTGHPADTVAACGVRAIWAAARRFDGVGCIPRRGYNFLFQLDQIFLFLGAKAVVVCRRLRLRW